MGVDYWATQLILSKACTQTLLRKMEELNGDTLKPSSHLKERNSEEEKQDRKFWRDLLHVEREAQDLYVSYYRQPWW